MIGRIRPHRARWSGGASTLAAGAVVVVAGAVVAGAAVAPTRPAALSHGFGPQDLTALRARFVGPLGVGGRITAIAAVESRPEVIFVGTAAGGVWKSIDGGAAWRPVFDDQPVAAIGALAVFQPRPEIVWAGTGEANRRMAAGPGRGAAPPRGFPDGEVGRMKLAFAPSRPQVAYAMVELARAGVLLRSEDGGRSWRQAYRHANLFPRPFFFGEMKVDPRRPVEPSSPPTICQPRSEIPPASKTGCGTYPPMPGWRGSSPRASRPARRT